MAREFSMLRRPQVTWKKTMGPQVDPVVSDLKLPPRADVVVIGGGIIGVAAALVLAQRGVQVVLLEKGHIAGEQSSRNWGWCRQAARDPREFDLIRESLVLWGGINARLNADTGFRTAGIVFAAHDAASEHEYRQWSQDAAGAGIVSEIVRGPTLAALLPGDAAPPPAALYCASDGRAEPQRATPAMALAARRLGATLMIGCAARGIDTAAGRVAGVVTERGTIACSDVVVAGGAWTRRILKDLGIALPQLKVRASVARTTPVAGGPEAALWDNVFAFRKRADGGYTIANGHSNVVPLTTDSVRFAYHFLPMLRREWNAFHLTLDGRLQAEWREAGRVPWDRPSPYESARVLDPEPDQQFLRAALEALRRRYPLFADVQIAQSWAGFMDVTPDAVPVISGTAQLPGLTIATGFSGHGFGIGPAAGQLAADLVMGSAPLVDPRNFRLSRFFDGTRPRPLTGV
jgi:glycine/D-amino acid oxidase-like deaminating enzyme